MRKFRVGPVTAVPVVVTAVAVVVTAALTAAVPLATGPSAGVQADTRADIPGEAVAPAGAAALAQPALAGRFAHVELHDTGGRTVARVDLARISRSTVLVTVRATGLTPGFHGIHIHAKGVCDPAGATPFASAGPHFNPTGDAEGMQAGAFPVLLVAPDGSGYAAFTDGNFRLDQLAGPDGTSVVIHSAPDNYANIPSRYSSGGTPGPDAQTMATGDAGTRIACGVIAAPGTGHFVQGWKSHAWT
jgi:Cu-Zn family superoxide dismutase